MQSTTSSTASPAGESMLAGILVDVSGSMSVSIRSKGAAKSRLECFREALEGLVRTNGGASDRSPASAPSRAAIFAYGFGFGNPLAQFMGRMGSPVQDLFALPNQQNSTIELSRLAKDWSTYKAHLDQLSKEMFGSTPMGHALRTANQRFGRESFRFRGERVLFLLSAGEPTDFSGEENTELADKLKESGVVLVTCFLTEEDVAEPRRLCGEADENWSSAARLMYDCASQLPRNSSFESCLREYGWKVDPEGRLFAQINQSELLAEFMSVILSPLKSGMTATTSPRTRDIKTDAAPSVQEAEPEMPPPLLPSPPRAKISPLPDPPLVIPERPLIPLTPAAGGEPYLPVWREDRIKKRVNWSAWIFGGVLLLILIGMLLFLHK